MNRQCLWFVVKEGVCRERGTDIHDEVVYGTVSGMHNVGLVLQQVIDALNNASLAEHDFVPHGHELLHIRCSLKPWHHLIVPFPSIATPLKTLLA